MTVQKNKKQEMAFHILNIKENVLNAKTPLCPKESAILLTISSRKPDIILDNFIRSLVGQSKVALVLANIIGRLLGSTSQRTFIKAVSSPTAS